MYILFQSALTVGTNHRFKKKFTVMFRLMQSSSKVFIEVTQGDQLIQCEKHEKKLLMCFDAKKSVVNAF